MLAVSGRLMEVKAILEVGLLSMTSDIDFCLHEN